MTKVILLIFVSVFLVNPAKSQDKAMDVCTLLRSAKSHDGKTFLVTGFITADQHSTAIGSEGCFRHVIMRYETDSQPHEFVAEVEDKRLKLDPRPFRVTVEGQFHRHVRVPLGYVSRIEVTRALSWEFVDEKTTVTPAP